MDMVYCGGSITNLGWTTTLSNWLNVTYPALSLRDSRLTYGGRTSWTQLVYLSSIVAKNPRLIFIDWAVNDTLGTPDAYAEALIRMLRTQLPNAVISVGIFTWPENYSHVTANQIAGRDLWLELISRYDLHTGDVFANDIIALEGADYSDADVEKYIEGVGDVHPNATGCAAIANGFIASLPSILPTLAAQWTPPLPARYTASSEDYEYDPIIRTGTDNDGETGTGWATVGTARESATANDTISWTGTFCSWGLNTNYDITSGVVAWSVDGGAYTNHDLTSEVVTDMLWNTLLRGVHTVTLKVVSGTIRINKFLAI